MNEKLQKAYLASAIIQSYYMKLSELSYQECEDTEEYVEIIDKLKKATNGEKTIYDEIPEEEIDTAIAHFKENDISNVFEARMYSRLNQSLRKRQNSDLLAELANIISSKIIIDVLKKVFLEISKLKLLEVPEEDVAALLLRNDIYKYNYLTGNDFIEQIALQYKFNILSLPTIKFEEIESSFKTSFVKKSAGLFYSYIVESIEELQEIETEDKYNNIYVTLFEMSRIEVMLPYLNKEYLIKLAKYLDSLKDKANNDIIKKIKKLIIKRKEEFE